MCTICARERGNTERGLELGDNVHCWDVLPRECIGGVADQETGLTHSSVSGERECVCKTHESDNSSSIVKLHTPNTCIQWTKAPTPDQGSVKQSGEHGPQCALTL